MAPIPFITQNWYARYTHTFLKNTMKLRWLNVKTKEDKNVVHIYMCCCISLLVPSYFWMRTQISLSEPLYVNGAEYTIHFCIYGNGRWNSVNKTKNSKHLRFLCMSGVSFRHFCLNFFLIKCFWIQYFCLNKKISFDAVVLIIIVQLMRLEY